LAPRTCESHHRAMDWLRALLAALLLAAPSMSAKITAEVPATPPQPVHAVRAVIATRFSKLEEITPANVGGLMPLVARTFPAAPQDDHADPTPSICPCRVLWTATACASSHLT